MTDFDYDLFVIGAGSGGVRAARMASSYGARVGICESFKVGGTCVVRGCIPKKLFVYASHVGEDFETAKGYATERVNEAEGDVAKFAKIYAEYEKAPEITRQRMYLETMAKVLPMIPEKWILEQGGADGGILMKLDLVPSK